MGSPGGGCVAALAAALAVLSGAAAAQSTQYQSPAVAQPGQLSGGANPENSRKVDTVPIRPDRPIEIESSWGRKPADATIAPEIPAADATTKRIPTVTVRPPAPAGQPTPR
jgi:hypothetical protein